MNRKAAAIIFDNGLSAEQVSIGRLVSHPLEPDNDYMDPPRSFTKTARITTLEDYGGTLVISRAPSKKISLKLTELFGINHERSSTASLHIKSKIVTKQTLGDYSASFKYLIDVSKGEGKGTILSWIQDKIDEGARFVYFIVGIHSITDAELTVANSKDMSNGLDLGAPVTDIVTHGASALADINALDVMVSLSVSKADAAENSFEIRGTRVVAVQYCAIKLRSRLRAMSTDRLAANHDGKTWKWFLGPQARRVISEEELILSEELEIEANVDQVVGGDYLRELEGGREDELEINTVMIDGEELIF